MGGRPGARSVAGRVQARLIALYGVDAPDVEPFVRPASAGREVLFLRESGGELEIALHLPEAALDPTGTLSLDQLCQVVEGVSHFIYLVERARRLLPTTHLELELQAEVDKFVLLGPGSPSADLGRMQALRERLYGTVTFLHAEGTEVGDRYRFANRLAACFATRLEGALRGRTRPEQVRSTLRRFFGVGLREKIEMALAA